MDEQAPPPDQSGITGRTSLTGLPVPGALPCDCGSPEKVIDAQNEGHLRDKALTLSAVVTVIILIAHIWFQVYKMTLQIPDIIWVVILAPWMGASARELIDLAKLKVHK